MSNTSKPIIDQDELESARHNHFNILQRYLSKNGMEGIVPARSDELEAIVAEAEMWLENGWPEEALKCLKLAKRK